MNIILLFRCKNCVGSAVAAPPSPVPVCQQCLGHMKPTAPLGDRSTIAPGEYEIRCIKPLKERSTNADWKAGSAEEVWVLRAVGYQGDGGEYAGMVGERSGLVMVGIREGRKVELPWEGLPAPGIAGGTVFEPTRHAAALELARRLAQ